MFKWTCFAAAALFLAVLGWMVNDIRLQIHESAAVVQSTGETVKTTSRTINDQLPAIVDKTRKTTETISEHLPDIVEKTRKATETLAELAEDIRQLKELAGVSSTARDQNLVAYADSLLDALEKSGGVIGVKKTFGSGLSNPLPAKEWVAGARKEALVLTVLAKSKKELATRLAKNKFGASWYVQVEKMEPVSVLDWLKSHHPTSKDVLDK